jgi:hypothetical protein
MAHSRKNDRKREKYIGSFVLKKKSSDDVSSAKSLGLFALMKNSAPHFFQAANSFGIFKAVRTAYAVEMSLVLNKGSVGCKVTLPKNSSFVCHSRSNVFKNKWILQKAEKSITK